MHVYIYKYVYVSLSINVHGLRTYIIINIRCTGIHNYSIYLHSEKWVRFSGRQEVFGAFHVSSNAAMILSSQLPRTFTASFSEAIYPQIANARMVLRAS